VKPGTADRKNAVPGFLVMGKRHGMQLLPPPSTFSFAGEMSLSFSGSEERVLLSLFQKAFPSKEGVLFTA